VNQSSGTVVAAIVGLQDRLYEVRFALGADTVAYWKLQHTSSGGTVRDQKVVFTGSNGSAEFVFLYKAEENDIFRVAPAAAIGSSFAAQIQAEVYS
jgi:hypothetical protein